MMLRNPRGGPPNISQMLRRIGDAKPQFFAIMDLTKGFYQAPLSEESKKFTAFTCSCGLYEWNRVPMGLKGAPSFFQMVLATIVFVGLIGGRDGPLITRFARDLQM